MNTCITSFAGIETSKRQWIRGASPKIRNRLAEEYVQSKLKQKEFCARYKISLNALSTIVRAYRALGVDGVRNRSVGRPPKDYSAVLTIVGYLMDRQDRTLASALREAAGYAHEHGLQAPSYKRAVVILSTDLQRSPLKAD